MDLPDFVIERLKESYQDLLYEASELGRQVGETWASDTASAEQLVNLERIMARGREANFMFIETDSDPSVAHRIAYAILGHKVDRDEAEALWDEILYFSPMGTVEAARYPAFYRAFCRVAVEVWQSAKQHIPSGI